MPQRARCVNCRTEVNVPETYAHGDHIKCATCNTQHRVIRGDALRLVIADVDPLRSMLRDNQQRVETLQAELKDARASFGIGANGFGIGVAYGVYQVGFNDAPLSQQLLYYAVAIAVASGLALEVANYLFLAKRKKLKRLAGEIESLREATRELQQKIRDASRV